MENFSETTGVWVRKLRQCFQHKLHDCSKLLEEITKSIAGNLSTAWKAITVFQCFFSRESNL
jgi:hypothetical protein